MTSTQMTLDDVYEKLKSDKIGLDKKFPFSHPNKTKGDVINLSLGRIWFNLLLPDDYPLVDEAVSKKKLDSVIKDIGLKYEPEEASDIITNLQIHAFKLSAINPKSFRIEAFTPPESWLKKKEKFKAEMDNYSISEFNKKAQELANELVKHIEKQGIGIQDVLNSGTKGGVADWQALLVSRGYTVDIEGNIQLIKHANDDGYDVEEYYIGAAQARRNYYYKSTMSAKPGYLARKVTMASAGLKVTNTEDCKTTNQYSLYVDSKLSKLIVGRYYLEGGKLKLIEKPSDVLDKTIKLRSPLYCKDPGGICQTCYGDLWKKINTRNVGIAAGGAVNNQAINEMMKMRHKASQVEIVEVDFISELSKAAAISHKLNEILDVQKNKITAKRPVKVFFDENEYDESLFIEFNDKYIIPGILDITVGEDENIETYTLPFNFKVNLLKPKTAVERDRNYHIVSYEVGEVMIKQEAYTKEVDPAVVEKLLEGGAKYITNPEMLLQSIQGYLNAIDLVHLEVIVSNMFRDSRDNTIPCRLTSYSNAQIMGIKKLPFITSWLSALSFEHVNKAITTGLLDGKDAAMDPIESVVLERFYNEDTNV